MEHKIIHTENYLLVVSDDEIKEGDLALTPSYVGIVIVGNIDDMPYTKTHRNWVGLNCDTCYDVEEVSKFKKIIAHLPLNKYPILQGVDLLPPLEQENDVEELANKEILYNDAKREWWKQGYNKAKEKYKYTEDDLLKAKMDAISRYLDWSEEIAYDTKRVIERYKSQLSQPKLPVAFKCETITMNKGYTDEKDYPYQECQIPKTTTNSQGQTVWVGEYVY